MYTHQCVRKQSHACARCGCCVLDKHTTVPTTDEAREQTDYLEAKLEHAHTTHLDQMTRRRVTQNIAKKLGDNHN